jgi:phenylpropionate dioxygenase-like ring-hydroxylating dioxygenase large terminal subunit
MTSSPPENELPGMAHAGLLEYWYAVCRSAALRRKPKALMLFGTPIVVFRNQAGLAMTLADRCPHRNAPLSAGTVRKNGNLQCAYHGWEFCGNGTCAHIPGRLGTIPAKWGHVVHYVTEERHGLVWVYASADAEPARSLASLVTEPPEGRYVHVLRELQVEAPLLPTLENALDVPHTAFLHRGLFRGAQPHRITATVTRYPDRVVTEYTGEPRPTGLIAKLLSPSGGLVEHSDRFILPSVAEVEYKIGTENHFLVTAYCTPVDEQRTQMFARVAYRTRALGWLIRPLLEAAAMRIFRQDAAMLKLQSDNQHQFGGEHYLNTELDLMGPHIRRLLKEAETHLELSAVVAARKVEFDA